MIKVDMDKIKEVKDKFNRLENLNEENVKIKIVVEILEILGYDPEMFNYEYRVYKGKKIADIVIKINNKEHFYVEVKNGYNDLSEDDVVQLVDYMHNRSIEWGLLSNGKELVLINDKIDTLTNEETVLKDKVVFRINLMTRREIKYLKFLSKEAIFDTSVTTYFKDIAQFKAYKYPLDTKPDTFRVYRGTLNDFFTYYADKQNKYKSVKLLTVDEFEEFLKDEQEQKKGKSKSVRSQNTFKNKYTHLRSMLIELKKYNYIPCHEFEKERDELINKLNYEEIIKDKSVLNEESISEILKFMENTEAPTRNKVIFLISLYMGLERSKLKSIEESMFDLDKNIIKIDERKIPLPNKLREIIKKLIEENKSKGIKGKYLFYTYYSKKYSPVTGVGMTDIFSRIKNINPDDERWAVFSPQFIRDCLIEQLFENNYSIEEISYLTGMELKNITKYISSENINSKVNLFKKKRLERKHPFEKFLVI